MATSLRRGLEGTAVDPMTGRVAEMKPTPRSPRLGMFADALMAVRDFANRAQIPQGVPLIGGEGIGSLVLGRAPEELVEMSYGNMPLRINPYAGQTASFIPEITPGRKAQVADLLSLVGVPGGGRMASAAMLGAMPDAGGLERAMLAYHGTPHQFERFDASKIGTGEGAQAYGHGLYFAESPDVAGGYAVNLANRDMTNQGRLNAHANAQRLVNLAGDPKYAADDLKFVLESQPDHPQKKLLTETLQMLESGDYAKPLKTKGSLYTVDIPDEMVGKMLDWDKPLSEQAPTIKAAIQKTKKMLPQTAIDDLGGDLSLLYGKDVSVQDFLNTWDSLTGRTGSGEEALRQQGIPGIRYLDQGSRGTGQGTSNFVVFPGEEQRVQILKRE